MGICVHACIILHIYTYRLANLDERRDQDDHSELIPIVKICTLLIAIELCAAEPCIIDEFLLDEVGWIACDVCSRWYHKYCCHLAEGDNLCRFQCKKH